MLAVYYDYVAEISVSGLTFVCTFQNVYRAPWVDSSLLTYRCYQGFQHTTFSPSRPPHWQLFVYKLNLGKDTVLPFTVSNQIL